MIRRYCDGCGDDIETSAVSERIEGKHRRRGPSGSVDVLVEVIVGTNGTWNKGDLCRGCVIDAVNSFDTRPKSAQAVSA